MGGGRKVIGKRAKGNEVPLSESGYKKAKDQNSST
jgi:hypothetical protein